MFRHCAMFKFKPETTDAQKAQINAGFDRLVELEVVQSFAHGPDAGLREGNWHHVVVADFNGKEDYLVYATHPQHVELLQQHVLPNISERAAVQYTFEGQP